MLLNYIKRIIIKTFDQFGVEIRNKEIHGRADDPYNAISLLLDREKTKIIIDAGASIGNTTKKLSDIFPLAKVYAIEPYPPFYEELNKKVYQNKNIKTKRIAFSNINSSAILKINRSPGTNSLLYSSKDGESIYGNSFDTLKELVVKCETIDHFIDFHSIKNVDLLKMDLQGSELDALEGANSILKSGKIKCILIEIMFQKHYKSQPLADKILHKLMSEFNYSLFNFYQNHYHHGYLCQVDALFFHASIFEEVKKKAANTFFPYSVLPII